MKILPEAVTKLGTSRPGLKRAFRQLRKLQWEGARATMAFAPSEKEGGSRPDFLVVAPGDRAFFIGVADERNEDVASLAQGKLFGDAGPSLETRGHLLSAFASDGELGNVPRLWWFPMVRLATLKAWMETAELPENLYILGQLENEGDVEKALHEVCERPLTGENLDLLRQRFAPECRVPESFVPRLPRKEKAVVREDGPVATPYLLDFDQEAWVKHDLYPGAEPEEVEEVMRSRIITGVAGSGKSLLLLYRLRFTLATRAGLRVLVTTHNKPLMAELKRRFDALEPLLPRAKANEVEFRHFFKWCGAMKGGMDVLRDDERHGRLRKIAEEIAPGNSWTNGFLDDEIKLIGEAVDDSLEAYRAMDRRGRGIGLDEQARRKMHSIYMRYRAQLATDRMTDWTLPVRQVLERVRAERLPWKPYDLILVDEGQFFAPVWFELLKGALRPGGEMVIAADPTQGFLKRGQSWKSLGLEVRGRVKHLAKSYRNSAPILDFARSFLERRFAGTVAESGDRLLPDRKQSGIDEEAPILVKARSKQDMMAVIVEEVAEAIGGGVPPGAMVVVTGRSTMMNEVESGLARKIGSSPVRRLGENDPGEGAVGLCSLNAVTGIERPLVFLAGIDWVFEEEGNPRLSAGECRELREENTKKIYMALTRPGQKLVILYQNDRTAHELRGKEGKIANIPLQGSREGLA